MNLELELFLNSIGVVKQTTKTKEELDSCYLTLQKSYYNDPRDGNGEVPF
jgi:hypothetical protein